MENNIPPAVEQLDHEEKKRLGVDCKLQGCYELDHKRRSSKKCTYHNCTKDDLQKAIDEKLKELFPTDFGEFWFYCFYSFCFLFVVFVFLLLLKRKEMIFVCAQYTKYIFVVLV